LKIAGVVAGHSTVVVQIGVALVQFNGFGIIINRTDELSQFGFHHSTVKIFVGIGRSEFERFGEIEIGALKIVDIVLCKTAVGVGFGKFGIETDGFIEVLDGAGVIA